jgi:hypothetical protein
MTFFTGLILFPPLLASGLGRSAHFWCDHSFLGEDVSE